MDDTADAISGVSILTFDILGTVLDMAGTMVPATRELLESRGTSMDAADFWDQWQQRQSVEQYHDTLIMAGHTSYLQTCRNALSYCLRKNGIGFNNDDLDGVMEAWKRLDPFDDAVQMLRSLRGRYRLVALSNAETWYLEHLVNDRVREPFDAVVSVDAAGVFKPHASVYRTTARMLEADPSEMMMVSAHSFDVMGARASGYRAALVDRYGLPLDESIYRPNIVVDDCHQLTSRLLGGQQ